MKSAYREARRLARSGAVDGAVATDRNPAGGQTTTREDTRVREALDEYRRDPTTISQAPLETIAMPPPEQTLVAPTRLRVEGFNSAMRLRVNGVTPLLDGLDYAVQPGPAEIEVDRLDASGSVVETRAGRATLPAGRTSVVAYSALAPKNEWSRQKRLLVAGLATVTVAGVVYLVASHG